MRFAHEVSLRKLFVATLILCVFAPFTSAQTNHLVLQFSTVGDSRQDPKKPDPSTVPVSAQDKNWLENAKALSRMLRTIEQQKSNFLFYDGDMIMGYGAAVVPADTSSVSSI